MDRNSVGRKRRALVCGAGGAAAEAWETGVITGMADAGIDVRNADLFVGTSAGSRVSAQITSGLTLEELFQRQVDPRLQPKELTVNVNFMQLKDDIARTKDGEDGIVAILQRIGVLATGASTVSESERRNVIAAWLPKHTWPEQRLFTIAVDVESGERRVFDRTSGVDFVDAVAASCAVPGIFPVVGIEGHHYMDGGVYSTDNADLAVDFENVLILALVEHVPAVSMVPLDTGLETLRRKGARVQVVHPDEGTEAVFASVGGNLLDPSVREGAARAGRKQGRSLATRELISLWQ